MAKFKGLFIVSQILLIIGFCNHLKAQSAISGQVVEVGSGETLPFATITIKGSATGTTTNTDGYFTLFGIGNNDLIEIGYVGYRPLMIKLDSIDFSKFLKVSLHSLSSELEEVVISANSFKILDATSGISSTTISTKQLALLPNIGETDIFRSLQLLPGVSGTNESSSGLYVRGGTPDQNLVLLDGMTVYKVDHFFGFFSAFNTNAVKDVQLFKGAFPARYGGRTSGVVDLTGKVGSFQKAEGGASINLISASTYFETPIGKNISFLVAARRSYSDIIRSDLYNSISDQVVDSGFNDPTLDPVDISVVEPKFYFYDLNTKLSYRPSDRDMITASLYSGQDFLDESRNFNRVIAFDQGVQTILNIDVDEQTDWGNRGASAKWSRQWNSKFYSNLLIASSEYFSTFDRFGRLDLLEDDSLLFSGSQQTFEDNKVIDRSFRADFEWLRNAKSKIEFGVSYTQTKVNYSNIRNDTTVVLSRRQSANFSSVYLSEERKIGEKSIVTLGIRLSDYEFENDLLFEPRVGITFQATSKLKLKGAFGRHYQFVNQIINENISEGSREFWLLADGELVDVSSATHFILGASYEVDSWLFDLEAYHKELTGLSEFSLRFSRELEPEAKELFFTGDGIAKGVEFLIQKKHGQYTGWVSYTLGSVRNTFDGLNNGNVFPALHDQLHEFKTVHSIEIDNWVLSSTFVYGSGKPFSEPIGKYSIELLDERVINYVGVGAKNGSRLPAYHRMDISATNKFKIGKADATWGLSIFNVYGRQNVWYKEYDFTQEPVLITDVRYLGFTPNLSFSVNF